MARTNYISSFDSGVDANLDSKLLNPSDYENQASGDIKSGDLTNSAGVKEGDLTGESSSSDRAGDLRASKRDSQGADGEADNIQAAKMASRRQQAVSEAATSDAPQSSNPVRKGTSSLLRSAWLNLVPSWGLTLIWINIHVFLGMVFGNKFFCKLGEEWLDRAGLKK